MRINFRPTIVLTSFIVALMLVGLSCTSKSGKVFIEGKTDYAGTSDWYFSKKPLHYKYADKIRFPVNPDEKGRFSERIAVDSAQIIELNIGDASYPIWAQPNKALSLDIERSLFPVDVKVNGYPADWDQALNTYLEYERDWKKRASDLRRSFLDGEDNRLITLYKERYQQAGKLLDDTPFKALYFKDIGEYLVKRLEWLFYLRRSGRSEVVDYDAYRKEVLSEAKQLNFFTFKSLWAQRAGIRDFTNAWANTFGVKQRLEEEYDQELIKYDVKRLGYATLDSARTAVLDYIEQPKALAYARLFLIAERMETISLKKADPSYRDYIQQYEEKYPGFTAFLRNFHHDMERVSPGKPAIPFELPDPQGQMHRMEEYQGKYVLLDFWASWCIPCLNEFPHMKELYENYSRDQFQIVGISIEKDSLQWRSAIKRFELPWVQLYAGEEFNHPLWNAYEGGGIPFYVLIDPEGNILRYNDIRPSFNLPKLLDSLINRQTANITPDRQPATSSQ